MKRNFLKMMIALVLMVAVPVLYVSCTDSELTEQTQPDDETSEPDTPEDMPEDTPDENPEPEPDPMPEPEPEPEDDGIIRILAIGNSFSQDAVEQYLYELFDAAGQKVIIGNLYIGGCRLDTHYGKMQNGAEDYAYRKVVDGVKKETQNVALLTGLKDEDWDYVSFQQASGSSGQYDTYTTYLPALLEYVQDNVRKPTLMFHQTWAYASNSNHSEFPKYDSNQMTMYNAIMNAVSSAMRDNPSISILIPSGTAIQNARTSYLGDSFNRDGYHLETTYGRYTAACTWYEAISGKSVVGNTYAPSTIDDMQKQVAQNAAHLAVLKPWEVTDMVDFKTPVGPDAKFDSPVYIDFGGGNTTAPAPWVRVASYSIDAPVYLKDEEGSYSSISITAMEGFNTSYNGVGSEPSSDIVIDSITYPKSVWADGICISGTKEQGDVGPAKVVISGFDPSATYDLTLLAVRYNGSADARITEYAVEGAQKSEPVQIFTGLKTFTSVESYEGYRVVYSDVAPSAHGTITIFVTGKDTLKAVDGHLNAVVISK